MVKTVCIRDSYTFYRKTCEKVFCYDYKEGFPVYIDIANGFIALIASRLLEGYDIRLPAKLGVIGIRGKKVKPIIDENGNIKGIAPNWGETKKLQARDPVAKENKTIVYCFNEHSNGIKYNFFWSKENVIIKNKSIYGITFSRTNRRRLAKLIVEDNKEYLLTN